MKKIVFMGTPDFSLPVLQALLASNHEVVLVVTQPDRPVGRKQELTPPPVKKLALEEGLPVFQPKKLADDYAEILSYEPDIIVTVAYGQLLPNELLEAPKYGCINVHASLLPELRGGAPIHYAILQGKKETGITIMYMDEKLDAGDIISQKSLAIAETDHVGILHDKLSRLGADLLMETLPAIFEENNERIVQDDEKATYAPNISREQEKINWQAANTEVYNQIRGLHPWPVAYSLYDDKRMKIWWSEIDEKTSDESPGTIINIEEDYFTVVCGNQKSIRITSIQPAGSKRMSVKEFLRGKKDAIQVGQKFT